MIEIVLPDSFSNRRFEFESYIQNAIENIKSFAARYGWQEYAEEPFMDKVMIFDEKKEFDKTLLLLAEADPTIELPETYCGALEKRTLLLVTPEMYSNCYAEGIEERSYEKLLTHEIAHRFHIRILNNDEEAMGPIWFYEGFAIFTADQFHKSNIKLSKEEIKAIMCNPERGSYQKYRFVFRYFAEKQPLQELVTNANNENFTEWLLSRK